jgi:hypothetical protein
VARRNDQVKRLIEAALPLSTFVKKVQAVLSDIGRARLYGRNSQCISIAVDFLPEYTQKLADWLTPAPTRTFLGYRHRTVELHVASMIEQKLGFAVDVFNPIWDADNGRLLGLHFRIMESGI